MARGIDADWTALIACCRPVEAGLPAAPGGRCTEAAKPNLLFFPFFPGRGG